MDPSSGVTASVDLVIDTTNADDTAGSLVNISSTLSEEWEVRYEDLFITSSPTVAPTSVPSQSPSTFLPTSDPTVTGMSCFIEFYVLTCFAGEV